MFRSALAVFLSLGAGAISAQVQTMGDISFAPPDGWKFDLRPGADHASVSLSNGGRFCVLAVYRGFTPSGDAEADFKSAWTRIVTQTFHESLPNPIYNHKAGAGYGGKESGTSNRERTRYYWMYLLESGQRAVPVLAIANSRGDLDNLNRQIIAFVEGLRIGAVKSQAAKTTITMADLVGDWHSGAANSTDYVNSNTGAYAGNSTVFYGEGYVIKADGSYSYRFSGMTGGHTVREQSAGTVDLGPGYVAFRDTSTNKVKRYWFISYQPASDGSTVLTLLPDSYPVTSSNINSYGAKWSRPAPRQ